MRVDAVAVEAVLHEAFRTLKNDGLIQETYRKWSKRVLADGQRSGRQVLPTEEAAVAALDRAAQRGVTMLDPEYALLQAWRSAATGEPVDITGQIRRVRIAAKLGIQEPATFVRDDQWDDAIHTAQRRIDEERAGMGESPDPRTTAELDGRQGLVDLLIVLGQAARPTLLDGIPVDPDPVWSVDRLDEQTPGGTTFTSPVLEGRIVPPPAAIYAGPTPDSSGPRRSGSGPAVSRVDPVAGAAAAPPLGAVRVEPAAPVGGEPVPVGRGDVVVAAAVLTHIPDDHGRVGPVMAARVNAVETVQRMVEQRDEQLPVALARLGDAERASAALTAEKLKHARMVLNPVKPDPAVPEDHEALAEIRRQEAVIERLTEELAAILSDEVFRGPEVGVVPRSGPVARVLHDLYEGRPVLPRRADAHGLPAVARILELMRENGQPGERISLVVWQGSDIWVAALEGDTVLRFDAEQDSWVPLDAGMDPTGAEGVFLNGQGPFHPVGLEDSSAAAGDEGSAGRPGDREPGALPPVVIGPDGETRSDARPPRLLPSDVLLVGRDGRPPDPAAGTPVVRSDEVPGGPAEIRAEYQLVADTGAVRRDQARTGASDPGLEGYPVPRPHDHLDGSDIRANASRLDSAGRISALYVTRRAVGDRILQLLASLDIGWAGNLRDQSDRTRLLERSNAVADAGDQPARRQGIEDLRAEVAQLEEIDGLLGQSQEIGRRIFQAEMEYEYYRTEYRRLGAKLADSGEPSGNDPGGPRSRIDARELAAGISRLRELRELALDADARARQYERHLLDVLEAYEDLYRIEWSHLDNHCVPVATIDFIWQFGDRTVEFVDWDTSLAGTPDYMIAATFGAVLETFDDLAHITREAESLPPGGSIVVFVSGRNGWAHVYRLINNGNEVLIRDFAGWQTYSGDFLESDRVTKVLGIVFMGEEPRFPISSEARSALRSLATDAEAILKEKYDLIQRRNEMREDLMNGVVPVRIDQLQRMEQGIRDRQERLEAIGRDAWNFIRQSKIPEPAGDPVAGRDGAIGGRDLQSVDRAGARGGLLDGQSLPFRPLGSGGPRVEAGDVGPGSRPGEQPPDGGRGRADGGSGAPPPPGRLPGGDDSWPPDRLVIGRTADFDGVEVMGARRVSAETVVVVERTVRRLIEIDQGVLVGVRFEELAGDVLVVVRDGWLVVDPRAEGMPSERSGSGSSLPLLLIEQFGAALIAKRDSAVGERPEAGERPADRVAVPPRARPAEGSEVDTPVVAGPDSEVLTEAQEDTRKARVAQDAGVPVEGYRGRGVPVDTVEMLVPVVAELVARYPEVLKGVRFAELPVNDREFSTAVLFDEALWDARGEAGELRDGWLVLDPRVVGLPVSRTAADMRLPEFVTRQFAKLLITRRSMGQPAGEVVEATRRGLRDVGVKPAPKREWKSFARIPLEQALEEAFVRVERDGQRMEDPSFPYYRALVEDRDTPVDLGRERRLWGAAQAAGVPEPSRVPPGQWPEVITGLRAELDNAAMENAARGLDPHALKVVAGLHEDRVGRFAALFELVHGRPPRPDEVPRLVGESEQGSRPAVREERARHGVPENRSPSRSSTSIPPVRDPGGGEVGDATSGGGDGQRTEAGSPLEARPLVAADREGGQVVRSERRSNNVLLVRRDGSVPDAAGDRGPGAPLPPGRLPGGDDSESSNGLIIGRTADFDGVAVVGASRVPAAMWDAVVRTVEGLIANYPDVLVGVRFEELERGVPGVVREGVLVLDPRAAEPVSELVVRLFADALIARPARPRGGAGSVVERAAGELAGEPVGGRDAEASSAAGELGAREQLVASIGFRVEGYQDVPLDALREWVPMLNRLVGQSQDATKGVLFELPAEPGHGVPGAEEGDGAPAFVRAGWLVVDPRQLHVLRYAESHEQLARRFESELRADRSGWERQVHGLPDGDADAVAEVGDRRTGTQGAEDPVVVRRADESASGSDEPVAAGEPDVLVATTVLARMGGDAGPVGGVMWARLQAVEAVRSLWEAGDPRFAEAYARLRRMEVVAGRLSAMLLSDARLLSEPGTGSGPLGTRAEVAATVSRLMIEMNALLANPIFTTGAEYSGVSSGVAMRVLHDLWGSALVVPDPAAAHGLPGGPELIPWMERIGASAVVWQAGNAWVATVQGGRAFRFDAEQYSWVPLDAGADLSGAKGVFLDGRGRLLDPPGSEGAGEVGDGGPPGAGPGNGGLSVRPPFAGEPEAAGPAVVRLRDPHGDVSLVSRDGSMPVTGGDGRRQGPGPAPDPLSVDDPTPDRLDAPASGSVEPIAAERGRTAPAESEEPSIRRRLEAAGVRIEGDPQVCARMLEAVGAVVERLVFRYPGVLRALLFGSLPQDGADAASIAGEGRLVLDPHAVPLSEAGRREQVTRRFGALLASHAENAVRRAHSFADSLRKQLREAGEERAGRNEWRRYRRMSLPEAVVEAFEYVEKNGFDLGHPSAAYYRALVGDAASALDFPREQRLWRLAVEAGVHDPHRLNSAGLARELVTLLDRLDADSDRLTEELPNMPGSVAAIVAGMHNDRVERYAALYQMIHGIPPRLFETPAEIRGFDNAAFRSGVSDGEESPWKQEAEALADERAADLGTRTRAELLVLASLFIDKKHLDIAVVAGQARPERLYGLREWAGFLDALAYARAHRGRDLSVPFLLELHRRLTPAYESQIGGVLTDSDRYALMTEPLTEQQKLALDANPYVSFNSRYRLDGAQGRLIYPNFPLENTALPGSDRQESFLQALCDWYNGVRRGAGDPYAIAAALQRILISVHPFGDFNGRLSRIVMNWALENAGLPPSALYDTNSDLFVSPQEWAAAVRAGSMRYERLLSRARLLGQDADLVQLFGLEDLHRRYRHFDGRIAPFTEGDNLYGVLERLYRDLDEFFVEPEVHTRRETAEQPANSPEELLRGELRAKLAAVDRSSVDSLIAAFFGGYPRDEVTDFYDGRRSGFKSREVLRAQMTVAETNGLRAFYLSADIANLGGLNLFASLRGESANAHFRAITDIFRSVLEESGAAVVPMRVGGDELAAVLVGLDIATVEALRTETERRVAEYARSNGLSDIEHPKHPGRPAYRGVGMYLGYAEILPGASLGSVFDAADLGVDRSKNSRLQQYNAETPGRVVWSGRTDNPQVPEQNQAPGTADRPNSVEPEAIRSRPVRVRYPSPDEVRRDELRTELAAVDLDSDEAVLDVLFDAGGIDEVSQLLDGRASGVKTAELLRMLDYVARTGDSAHVIVAKMWNLGGLNQHFANQAEVTNHHFRRIAEIFRTVVEEAGGWAVPMRLEGPRLGANVAGIDPARIASVAATVEHRVREYAREHGLADIPHPKNPEDPGRRGVRLHVGYAEVRPGGNVAETFESAERRLSNGTRDAVARSAAVTVVVDERLARAPGAEVRSGQVIRYPGGSLAVVAEPGDHLRALARAARRDPDVARALADESVPLVQVEVPLFDGGQPRTSSLDRATLGPVEEPARTAAADLLPAPELPLRDRLAALADLDPAHARVVLEVVRGQVRDVLSERVREAFAMLGSAPPRYSVGDRGEVTDPVSAHPREVLAALRIAGVSDHMYEAVARSFAELRAVDQRIAWADADLVDWVRSVGNSPGPVVFRRPPADFAVCGQLAVVARNAWYHDVPGSVAVRLPDTSQNFAEPIEPAGFSWLVGGHAKYLVGGLAEAAALVSGAAKGQDFRSMDPAVRAGNSGRAVLVVRSGADEGKAAFVVNDEGTIKLIDLQNGTSTTLGEEVNGEGVWHGVELDSIGNPVDPIRWQSPDDDRAVPPAEATAVEARVLDRRLRLQVGIGGDGNPASDGTGYGNKQPTPAQLAAVREGILALGNDIPENASREQLYDILSAMLTEHQAEAVRVREAFDHRFYSQTAYRDLKSRLGLLDDRVIAIRKLIRQLEGAPVTMVRPRDSARWEADSVGNVTFAYRIREAIAGAEPIVEILKHPETDDAARVDVLTFEDGWKVIRKHVPGDDGSDSRHGRIWKDAEKLASLVGEAVGARVPAVHIVDQVVFMEYIEGPSAAAAWLEVAGPTRPYAADSRQIAWPYAQTADGRRIGLLDELIHNDDRIAGNWIISGAGRLFGIDHELSFQHGGYSLFADRMRVFVSLFGPKWMDPLGSVGDYFPEIRERLEELLPDFEDYGRTGWHRGILELLDALEESAIDRGRQRLAWELDRDGARASLDAALSKLPEASRPDNAPARLEGVVQWARANGAQQAVVHELSEAVAVYEEIVSRIASSDREAATRLVELDNSDAPILSAVESEAENGIALGPAYIPGNPLDGMHLPDDANCFVLTGFAVNDFYYFVREGVRAIDNLSIEVDSAGLPFELVEWFTGGRTEDLGDVRQGRARIARRLLGGLDDLPDGWPHTGATDSIDAGTRRMNAMRGMIVVETRRVEHGVIPGHAYFVGNRNGVLRTYDFGGRYIGEFDPGRIDPAVVSVHVVEFTKRGDPAEPVFVDGDGRPVRPVDVGPETVIPEAPADPGSRPGDVGSLPPDSDPVGHQLDRLDRHWSGLVRQLPAAHQALLSRIFALDPDVQGPTLDYLNEVLAGDGLDPSFFTHEIAVLDLVLAMRPLPEAVVVSTTLEVNPFGRIEGLQSTETVLTGYLRTVLGIVPYGDDTNPYHLEIAVPAGTPALLLGPLSPLGRYFPEIVLGRDLVLRIDAVDDRGNGSWSIRATVAPPVVADSPSNYPVGAIHRRDGGIGIDLAPQLVEQAHPAVESLIRADPSVVDVRWLGIGLAWITRSGEGPVIAVVAPEHTHMNALRAAVVNMPEQFARLGRERILAWEDSGAKRDLVWHVRIDPDGSAAFADSIDIDTLFRLATTADMASALVADFLSGKDTGAISGRIDDWLLLLQSRETLGPVVDAVMFVGPEGFALLPTAHWKLLEYTDDHPLPAHHPASTLRRLARLDYPLPGYPPEPGAEWQRTHGSRPLASVVVPLDVLRFAVVVEQDPVSKKWSLHEGPAGPAQEALVDRLGDESADSPQGMARLVAEHLNGGRLASAMPRFRGPLRDVAPAAPGTIPESAERSDTASSPGEGAIVRLALDTLAEEYENSGGAESPSAIVSLRRFDSAAAVVDRVDGTQLIIVGAVEGRHAETMRDLIRRHSNEFRWLQDAQGEVRHLLVRPDGEPVFLDPSVSDGRIRIPEPHQVHEAMVAAYLRSKDVVGIGIDSWVWRSLPVEFFVPKSGSVEGLPSGFLAPDALWRAIAVGGDVPPDHTSARVLRDLADFRLRIPAPPVREFSIMGPVELWVVTGALRFPVVVEYIEGGRWRLDPQSRGIAQDALVGEFGNIVARDPAKLMERLAAELVGGRVKAAPAEHPGSWPASASRPERVAELEHSIGLLADAVSPSSPELVADTYGSLAGRLEAELATLSGAQLIERHYSVRRRHGEAVARYREVLRVLELPDEVLLLDLTRDDSGGERVLAELRDRLRTIEAALRAAEQSGRYRELARQADIVGWYRAEYPRSGFAEPYWFPGQQVALIAAANSMRVAVVAVEGYHAVAEQRWREAVDPAALENLASGYWVVDWLSIRPDETGERVDRLDRIWREASGFDAMAPAIGVARLTAEAEALRAKIDMLEGPLEQRYRTVREPVLIQQRFAELAARSGENTDSGTAGADTGAGAPAHHNAAVAAVVDALVVVVGGAAQVVAGQVLRISDEQGSLSVIAEPGDHLRALARAARSDPAIARVLQGAPAPIVWVEVPVDGTAERRVTVTDGPVAAPFGRPIDRSAETFFPPDAGSLRDRLAALTDLDPVHARVALEVVRGQISDALSVRLREVFPAASQYAIGDRGEVVDVVAAQPARTLEAMRRIGVPEHIYAAVEAGFAELRALERHIASVEADLAVWLRGAVSSSGPVRWGQSALFREPPAGFNLCGQLLVVAHNAWYHDVPGSRPMRLPATPVDPGETIAPPAFSWMIGAHAESLPRGYAEALEWVSGAEPGQDHRSVAPEVRTSSSGRGMIMFEDGGGETAAFLIVNDAGTVRVIDLGAGYIGPPADPIDTSGRWHGARLDRRGVPVDPIASDLAVELPVVDKTFRLLEGIGGSAGKDPIGTGDSGIPAETAMPYPASPRDTVAVPDTSGAVEFDSPESVRAYADEHWGHGAEHRRLLDIYITEGSAINRYLRGDTGWRDSTMKPWAAADVDAIVEQLRSVMAPLPDAVVVRRYVDARFISGLRRGDIVPESAFISTIADPEPPFFLEHSTGILTLTVPAGVPVAFLRNGFNELLLTDGLSWRVIDSVTSDDETAVQVRGIVDWDPPPVEPPVRHGKPPEPDTGAVHDHETPVAEPATGVADRPVAAPAPLSPQRAEAVRAGIAGLGEQVRADAGRRELRETLEAMLSREQSAAVHLADSYDRAEVRADEYIGSIYAMDDRVAEIRRLLRMVGVDVADEIQRSLIPRPADHEPSDIPFADRHLEARAQSEPTVTVLKLPGDGQLFRVELHTFDDGWQVIAKVVHSEPAADPERLRRDLDAEELGALVGRTVGGPFPRVHRMDDALYMEFVDGPDALAAWKAVAGPTRLLGGTDEEIAFPYLNSADGRLIGFVDWLIGNGDRNAANWIINQWDRIVGIDHEMTFGYRRLYSYFAVGMKAHLPLFGPDWIDPVAPMRDFAGMRQRLGGLLPEFEARGRGDWHRAMMARLDELERTAVDYGRLRLSWELEHAESRARVEDSLRRATADLPGRRVLLAEAMVAPEYTMQRLRTGGIPGELIAELAGNIGEYGKSTDRIELADGEAAGRLRTVEAETYALHRIGDERRKGVELAPGHVLGNPLDGMHPPNDANCVALAGFAINDFYHYVRNGRRAISNLAISVDLDGFPFEAVEWVMGGRLEGFADVRQARVRIARRLWSGNDDLPDGWPDADPDDGIDATTKSNNRMRGILVIEERLVEGKAVPGHAYFVGNRNGVLRLYDYGTRFIGEFDPRRNDSRVVSIHVIEFLPTGDPADPLFVDAEGRRVHPLEADPDAALPAPPVFRSPRVRKLLDIGSPPPEGFETTGVPDGPEGDTGRGAEPLIRQGRPTVDLSITDPNPMEIVLHKLGERVADVSVLIDRGAGIAALGAEVRAGQRRSVLVPEDALRYLREQPGWSAPRDGEGARLVNDSLSATTRWDGGPRLSDALARSWQQPGGLLRIASLPDVYAVLQERGRPQDLLFAGDIRAHLHDPRRAPLPPHILARYMDMMRAIMSEAALAHPDADVAIRLAAGGLHTTYTLYGEPDIGRFNQIIGGLEQPRFLVPAAYHNGFGLLADGAVLQAQLRRIGARPDEQLDAAAADTASDAVYGFGRRSDNPLGYDELLSARLLRAQALALGYPRERADRLYNMVMGSGFDQATKRQVGKYDPDPLVQGVTAVDLFTLVSTWAMEDALAIAVEDLTSARFSKDRVLGQVLAEYNLRIRSLEEAMAILDTYGDYRPIIDGERSEKTLRRLFIERLLGNQGFTLAHEFPPTWQLVDPRLRQINAIASKAFADALARTDARGRPIFSFVQVLRTAKEFGHRMEQLFGPYGFERV
ncbi:Fic family protein [Nocardia flavorosea]|uniref:Fic family protein n=1 Tax=Nocardia flavorosea TaxID=53429 RepID=UPI00226BCFED|nr:Fic family protein [Nocardia flavorosea]